MLVTSDWSCGDCGWDCCCCWWWCPPCGWCWRWADPWRSWWPTLPGATELLRLERTDVAEALLALPCDSEWEPVDGSIHQKGSLVSQGQWGKINFDSTDNRLKGSYRWHHRTTAMWSTGNSSSSGWVHRILRALLLCMFYIQNDRKSRYIFYMIKLGIIFVQDTKKLYFIFPELLKNICYSFDRLPFSCFYYILNYVFE